MSRTPGSVLVADRPGDATSALVAFLRDAGFEVFTSPDDAGALHTLDEERVDCLVCELRAPRLDGMAVLRRALALDAEVCAVMVTDGAPLELAIEAMRLGAYDVQVRPLHHERVIAVVSRGLAHRQLAARVVDMEADLDRRVTLGGLEGRSRAITRVTEQIRHLGASRAPVPGSPVISTGKGL
ncbi:MAG: response regulator, partial [Candidatus Eisenbacteria bacterium]|nr:response regulator [Candidatus Eisenbacteria bacterium]